MIDFAICTFCPDLRVVLVHAYDRNQTVSSYASVRQWCRSKSTPTSEICECGLRVCAIDDDDPALFARGPSLCADCRDQLDFGFFHD